MNNANALSYYWHLRAQDIAPDAAREHVRLRYGVTIGRLIPADECVTESPEPVMEPYKPAVPDWVRNGETIFGSISTPQRS